MLIVDRSLRLETGFRSEFGPKIKKTCTGGTIMNKEELNTALYKKMFAEQDNFRNWLLTQPPEEILRHAYEYTIREDILLAQEIDSLEYGQAAALMDKPSLLSDLFEKYAKLETDYMETIQNFLKSQADIALQAQRTLPVYRHSAEYAIEQGELDIYYASHGANIACSKAIETAITEHFSNYRLNKECVPQVVELFGYDRMFYVLAATVRGKDWDGRISNANKEWARSVPVIEDREASNQNHNFDFLVDHCHPGLTDIFINIARHDYSRTLQITKAVPKNDSFYVDLK